jgi:hypothetical protein
MENKTLKTVLESVAKDNKKYNEIMDSSNSEVYQIINRYVGGYNDSLGSLEKSLNINEIELIKRIRSHTEMTVEGLEMTLDIDINNPETVQLVSDLASGEKDIVDIEVVA